MKTFISFIIVLFTFSPYYVFAQGKPFQELWEEASSLRNQNASQQEQIDLQQQQIADLQQQIDDLRPDPVCGNSIIEEGEECETNSDCSSMGTGYICSLCVCVYTPVPELPNQALDIEKSFSNYAYISDASQNGLDITGDFTIEAWIKLESASGVDVHPIVNKWGVSDNYSYYFYYLREFDYLGIALSKNGIAGSDNADYLHSYTSLGISVGVWYHVAVSWVASTSTATFYVDGAFAGSDTGTITSIFNSGEPFQIGYEAPHTYLFDGVIDDVRIWNDIRTNAEIADNLHNELTGSEDNLQGYWKFNGNLNDSSSNGNNLFFNGTPVFVE